MKIEDAGDLLGELWAFVSPHIGWVVGMDWPEADEDVIFGKTEAFIVAAKAIHAVAGDGNATHAAVRACMDGVAATSFGDYWKQFTDAGPELLPTLGRALDDAAKMLHGYGLDVEYTKYMIIGSLILLAYQIAYFIALAYPSFGASLGLIPEACAITQMTIRGFAITLLRSIGVMEGMDAGIQFLQEAEGHRTEWDWDKSKTAVEGGVFTGLAFAGMGGLMSRLGGPRLASGLARGDMTGQEKFAAFMTNSVGGHMLQSSAANMVGSVPMLAAGGQLDLEHLAKAGTAGLVGGADGHLIKPTSAYAAHAPIGRVELAGHGGPPDADPFLAWLGGESGPHLDDSAEAVSSGFADPILNEPVLNEPVTHAGGTTGHPGSADLAGETHRGSAPSTSLSDLGGTRPPGRTTESVPARPDAGHVPGQGGDVAGPIGTARPEVPPPTAGTSVHDALAGVPPTPHAAGDGRSPAAAPGGERVQAARTAERSPGAPAPFHPDEPGVARPAHTPGQPAPDHVVPGQSGERGAPGRTSEVVPVPVRDSRIETLLNRPAEHDASPDAGRVEAPPLVTPTPAEALARLRSDGSASPLRAEPSAAEY